MNRLVSVTISRNSCAKLAPDWMNNSMRAKQSTKTPTVIVASMTPKTRHNTYLSVIENTPPPP
jgi:hypothetical protein